MGEPVRRPFGIISRLRIPRMAIKISTCDIHFTPVWHYKSLTK